MPISATDLDGGEPEAINKRHYDVPEVAPVNTTYGAPRPSAYDGSSNGPKSTTAPAKASPATSSTVPSGSSTPAPSTEPLPSKNATGITTNQATPGVTYNANGYETGTVLSALDNVGVGFNDFINNFSSSDKGPLVMARDGLIGTCTAIGDCFNEALYRLTTPPPTNRFEFINSIMLDDGKYGPQTPTGKALANMNLDDVGYSIGYSGPAMIVGARYFPTMTSGVRGILTVADELPLQMHHYATNKNLMWTPKMADIAKDFGLGLNEPWNMESLPHLGRHPNAYHQFVLDGMQRAAAEAGGSQSAFIKRFDIYVKQPIRANPGLLRKAGWQ
ncbi:hypothetical protein BH11BAC7_BH11BAC7_33060 [soil metagenome]